MNKHMSPALGTRSQNRRVDSETEMNTQLEENTEVVSPVKCSKDTLLNEYEKSKDEGADSVLMSVHDYSDRCDDSCSDGEDLDSKNIVNKKNVLKGKSKTIAKQSKKVIGKGAK